MAGTPTSGTRLKELRKQQGMTLKDLAKETGIVMQQLSYMERGQRPITMKYALPLANFFQVSIDYLVATDGGLKKRYHIQLMDSVVSADTFSEFMKEAFERINHYSIFNSLIESQSEAPTVMYDTLLYQVITKIIYGEFDNKKLRMMKDFLQLMSPQEVQVP